MFPSDLESDGGVPPSLQGSAVEPCESVIGAEPHQPVLVLQNFEYGVGTHAVFHPIVYELVLLRTGRECAECKEKDDKSGGAF